MSQTPSQPEETKAAETDQVTPAPAAPASENASAASEGKNDNLAFTNPDEYKHKHGEHNHGEHKHHHHHHHRHRHFHPFDLSISGIRNNLKLMFKSIYSYPYILLFLSLFFLFFMNTRLVLSLLNAQKGSFSSAETFYRWQEYLVMNKAFLTRIPFLFTLLVTVAFVIFLMQQRARHWQRNVMKILPALCAAAIFSIPMGSGRSTEEFARSACRDCLRNYYNICSKFAGRRNGAFPKKLPQKSSSAASYTSDHYVYHGAGKTINDEPFVLIEDKNRHIGNYRYAVRSDGMLLVSKFGGLFEEYLSVPVLIPSEDEEEDDFDWDEDLSDFITNSANDQITIVEGTIEERSILPDPEQSDYPNCRFTAHFIGNTILSGQTCPKEINLVIEGFANYSVLSNNKIENGDKVLCTLIPFDSLPEDEQSTQQADDLELYLLDDYYAVEIKKIDSFSDSGFIPSSGILFSDGNDDYISIFDRHINPPVSEKLKTAQNESIQNDLEKMNRLLDGFDEAKMREINGQFNEAWSLEQEKDAPGRNRVGDFVWRKIDNSFWTLPQRYNLLKKPEELSQEMLDCFASLKKVLEANGVQLIVSIVPDLNVISSRVINKQFRDLPDLQLATYVKQLSETGIETIYPSDSIIRNYNRYPFAFFYPANNHPSDTVQDVLSDLLAERLKRYDIPRKLKSELFSETQSLPKVYGEEKVFQFPGDCDIGNNKAGSDILGRKILYDKAEITRSKDSPILLIGNSFMETPVSPPESLPSLLTRKMCTGIDWYKINAHGPFSDIMIRLLTTPETFLKGKKVLIMQVGTTHMFHVNRNESMLDIGQLDSERTILNNRKMKTHFTLSSNVNNKTITDEELWGPLSNADKTVLRIDGKEELEFSFDLEQTGRINAAQPVICFIPHMCVRNTTCKMTINDQQKTMRCPNHASNEKFFNLAFELPAGTKKLTIKITGKEDSLFAIKDIQIWQ